MSQFNPNQYEFLFEEKRRPQGYRPTAVAKGFKNPNQPKKAKLAVPTDADLKKGLRALIQKHGSIAAVPAAEAKKFLNRFQNHPLKRGMKLKGEGAANKAIKTLADKMKVGVAIKPTGAKPKAARGQMKLRGEYEKAAEKRRAATAATPAADEPTRPVQREPKGKGSGLKTYRGLAGEARKLPGQFAEEAKKQRTPGAKRPAPAKRTKEQRLREYKARTVFEGKKAAAKAATEGAKTAGKQLGKSALARAGAGLGLRALMPLMGGVPGIALLALSMLPVLASSRQMSATERSRQIKARKHQYDMQRIMAGQAAPTPMDKLLQSNRLSAIQRMRRGGEITGKPYQLSPELTGLLGESRSELMTRLKQMPGQERKINLEDVMNMNMAGGH